MSSLCLARWCCVSQIDKSNSILIVLDAATVFMALIKYTYTQTGESAIDEDKKGERIIYYPHSTSDVLRIKGAIVLNTFILFPSFDFQIKPNKKIGG